MVSSSNSKKTAYFTLKKAVRKAKGNYTVTAARQLRAGTLSVKAAMKERGIARTTARRLKNAKLSAAEKRALLVRGIDQAVTKLLQQKRSYKNTKLEQPKRFVSAQAIRDKMISTPSACGLPRDFKIPCKRQIERVLRELNLGRPARQRISEKLLNTGITAQQWRSMVQASGYG